MGKVYIVGAGPGDPDLLTIKGLKAIKNADVIIYDRLVSKEILTYAKENAKLIYCGKEPGKHALIQENINHLLCQYGREDKVVTRLKGGDPFIFGRGGEEALILHEAGIPFEIVPGITSGAAAPAYAGIPLTHRTISSSVTIISGVKPDDKDTEYWRSLVNNAETLCIYMGVYQFLKTRDQLLVHGMDPNTPIAFIEWGTTTSQKTVTATLETIDSRLHEVTSPSMIIIGEVVKLRDQLKWFEESLESSQAIRGSKHACSAIY